MPGFAAGIERLDEALVTLGDDAAAHLAGAGQFAVIGVQFLVQYQEAPDLRGGEAGLRSEVAVGLLDATLDQIVDQLVAGQLLVGGISKAAPLRPVADRLEIDVGE